MSTNTLTTLTLPDNEFVQQAIKRLKEERALSELRAKEERQETRRALAGKKVVIDTHLKNLSFLIATIVSSAPILEMYIRSRMQYSCHGNEKVAVVVLLKNVANNDPYEVSLCLTHDSSEGAEEWGAMLLERFWRDGSPWIQKSLPEHYYGKLPDEFEERLKALMDPYLLVNTLVRALHLV